MYSRKTYWWTNIQALQVLEVPHVVCHKSFPFRAFLWCCAQALLNHVLSNTSCQDLADGSNVLEGWKKPAGSRHRPHREMNPT